MDPVVLKVIIDHRSEKLTLPSGITDTVDHLHKNVKDTFELHEDFTMHYFDEDFGDYFTLHSTNQVQHKGTIKVLIIPSIVLSLAPTETENVTSGENCCGTSRWNSLWISSSSADYQSDGTSSSQDTVILSPQRASWPTEIVILAFSGATEAVLRHGNEDFKKDGTVVTTPVSGLKSWKAWLITCTVTQPVPQAFRSQRWQKP